MGRKSTSQKREEEQLAKLSEDTKRSEILRLLVDRRIQGLPINQEFATEIFNLGLTKPDGEAYTSQGLSQIFTRSLNKQAEENRANFQSYQELQKLRLERLLQKTMEKISDYENQSPVSTGEAGEYVEITHKDYIAYIKETRAIIAELSKLTGANAPIELMVTARLEKEVKLISDLIQECLPEESFNEVAGILAHAMGESSNRLGESERVRKAEIVEIEAQFEELDT